MAFSPEYLFSKSLRSARLKAGLTQQELAEKLCISQQGYNLWENGERLPRLDRMRDLIEILGIDPYEMLFGPNDDFKADLAELAKEKLSDKELLDNVLQRIENLPDDTLTLWRYDKRYQEWLRLTLQDIILTTERC